MPYIAIHTSAPLDRAQKDAVKTAIGAALPLIPGKSEKALMIDISDGHTMYLAGEESVLAFVDVRCFGDTTFENKKAFTEAVFAALEREAKLQKDAIYLTYSSFENWGSHGTMR